MCLFRYREKRYGKLAFILFALGFIAIAAAAVFGGVYAVMHMSHWAKYIIVSVAGIFALLSGGFGLYLFAISFSLINHSKSVRDGNKSKGISGTYLCDKCGRVISKHAEFCEHCGAEQETNTTIKCPNCKAKNEGTAAFCQQCGYEFKK